MITPMKKVMLAGRLADREPVLSCLRDAGVVHVEPATAEPIQVAAEQLKEIGRAAKAAEILGQVAPAPDPSPIPYTPSQLVDGVHDLETLLAKLAAEKSEIEHEMERVAVWGHIDRADLEAIRESGLQVEFLVGPEGTEGSIEADLREIIKKNDGVVHLIAVSRNPIPPSPRVTRIVQPARDILELERARDTIIAEHNQAETALGKLATRTNEVLAYHQELLERKAFTEVELGLLSEGPIFILQGWAPEDATQGLEDRMGNSGLRVALQMDDPTEEETPPTKLRNPWWARPIECLYQLLGVTPGYREVDISPVFLPFLTIFTAMLFADAGYGLVAFLGLAFFYKSLTAKGVPKDIMTLFLVLFGGVVVYGVLTNTYFGETLIKLTPFDSSSPSGEQFLKKFCFFLGALHITIAHLWKIRRNPIGLTSLSEVGWILFVWAMFSLVCVLVLGEPQPPWMLKLFGASVALVLFFTAPSWNIFACIGNGLGAIALSAAGFLSDVISYIRLWAVGLAGGILAASFNELASPLPLVLAAVILIAAHLMNMALCMVAVFAHGVRLNLLEFSNHIGMEWSGREYDPFKKR